jgi:hypothetical protein
MMQVPAAEVEDCLQWLSEQTNRPFSLANDFAMSSKIYMGELCSFTTIQPEKNKDDYWCNDDMCIHLIEAVLICKWVHRRLYLTSNMQPQFVFIFDGSSNHGAKAPDALHVGGGINRDPGGKNAPGSKGTPKNPDGYPKMRNGWYFQKETQVRKEQDMHRKVLESDSQLCKDTCNVDGTTHKGIFEILQERGDNCIALDNKPMTKTCSKQRRRDLHFATDMSCDSNVRCCLENTLRWEPDFAAQKCKLHEACESMGVTFMMMMICHPECNPIEGTYCFAFS